MDPNVFYFVSSSEGSYHVYALDISGATDNFEYPIHALPDPIISLPISENKFLYNMTFGSLGSRLYMIGGYKKRPSDPEKPKQGRRSVYVVDVASEHGESIVAKAPSLIARKQHPIVVPLSDRLYVISSSLNPGAMQPLIEYLDLEHDTWAPVQLPPYLVQLDNQPIQGVDDDDSQDPYLIESYATRGSDILLSLSMSQTHGIGVFVLDTRTHSWSSVQLDPDIPYLGRCLYVGDIWLASDTTHTTNAEVWWTQCSGLKCAVNIASPVLYQSSKVVEYGERMLLAFSWTTNPKSLRGYEQNSALVRVDFVRICREMQHWDMELKTQCRIVRAINYGEDADIGSSSSSRKRKGKGKGKGKKALPSKVQSVHYCFIAPASLRMEATLRPCRGLGLRMR